MKILFMIGEWKGKWEKSLPGGRNGLRARMLILLFTILSIFSMTGSVRAASARTVTVWIQVTDSCRQALSGATFTVVGPGIHATAGPTNGGIPLALSGSGSGCPIQYGTCMNFGAGCTTTVLNVPSSGVATYTITVAKTAPGYGSNLRYAICNGGSDCRHGPEVATVRVSSNGSVAATVLNHYPDGATVVWPGGRAAFNGSRGDPIMFHEFGIGDGSIQCDGDHDADDYLTGTPGSHCDSNRKQHPASRSNQHSHPRRRH